MMASKRQLSFALVQYALMMVHLVEPAAGVNFHDKAQALKPVGILRREADLIQLDSKAQALKSHVLGLAAALDALEVEIVQTPNGTNTTTTAGSDANGSSSTAVTRTNGSSDANSSSVTPGSNTSGIPIDTSNSTSTSVTNTDDSNSTTLAAGAGTSGGGGSTTNSNKGVVGPNGQIENQRTHEVIDRSVASNVSQSDKIASHGSRQNDSWNSTTDTRSEKDKTGPDPLDPPNTTR